MLDEIKRLLVFEYREDYRDYLKDTLSHRVGKGRGLKIKLAQAIGCQSGFLSQVLGKHSHFNLEHGEKVCSFLDLTEEEAHFFLLLIQKTRAGTKSLRSYFDKQLQEIVDKRLVLKNRFQSTPSLSLEDQSRYYSAWYFGAIRVLLTIPRFRSRDQIARRLGLPPAKTMEVLEFLISRGLARQEGELIVPTELPMHLGNDSSMIAKHHFNWRNRSLNSLDLERPDDLHYSSVVSLAREDAPKLKEMTIQYLKEVKALVKKSPAEELFSFNLDFFEV